MTQSELEQLLEKFRARIKQDYVKLLDLLAQVLRKSTPLSTTDLEDRERLSMALGLINKFVEHAVTILYLSRGTEQNLPSFKFSFIDSASIDVLIRVALEAFLTFHYVFYVPDTVEERNYRYWAYKAAGIVERQDFPALTEKFKQKRAADKEQLDKLHQQLRSNPVFRSLTDKQQGRILKGEWRLKSWREIAIDAGFSKMIASDMYRLLSGCAHSSSLSVVQAVGAHIDREDEQVISSSMSTMNIVIANMTKEYCRLFSKAQDILSKDLAGKNLVEEWIQRDRLLDDIG